jgi:G3E family GTPase
MVHLMQPLIADRIPTHIITGFLGAGKTTLLRELLKHKPVGETWAVLVNEFGQIGLDGALLDQQDDGIAIREVAGGCLCCTSQLPMQIGLARLLTQAKPQRLFIEPTGLGHPVQLVEQLTEDHWQQALDVRALITVVDGTRLDEGRITTHESFRAQLQMADVVAVSHHDQMTAIHQQQLVELLQDLQVDQRAVYPINYGDLALSVLDQPRRSRHQVKRSLLHRPRHVSVPTATESTDIKIPFHYVEQSLGQEIGGWRLPAEWQFDRDRLLLWLLSLQDWLRIKGVIHTTEGWIAINLIPNQIGFNSHQGGADNRLEIINMPDADWAAREAALMNCLVCP